MIYYLHNQTPSDMDKSNRGRHVLYAAKLNAQVNGSNTNKDIPLVPICLLVQIQSATCKQVAENRAEALETAGWV